MRIRQDPVTKLWAREDGAILLPPSGRFKKFRWSFGWDHDGYRKIQYGGKCHSVHRIICRAFHGLSPEGKPEVDHADRCPSNNREDNLRWADRSLNCTNRGCVDRSAETYGVRCCDDPKAYMKAYNKAYNEAHREERKAYDEAHHEDRKAYHKAYNAGRIAEKKAQGLHYCKGPDGKWGWFPRANP